MHAKTLDLQTSLRTSIFILFLNPHFLYKSDSAQFDSE